MSTSPQTSNTWRLIGAILLILLLIVLWMMGRGPGQAGCCGAPMAPAVVPVVAPAAPVVAAAPAKVNAAWDGSKILLTGEVATEADKKGLVDAAIAQYGAGNVIDQITVKAGLGALAGITLTGIVPSDEEKRGRFDAAKRTFAPTEVDNQLIVKEPIAATAEPKAPDCSKAMNLDVEFATGSATISAAGKRYLDAVVNCVTGPMEVAGHTDNVGGDAPNMKLSIARATSVKTYLVNKGVKAELLTAQGYGESKPVADNSTAAGRAKNRRIELTAK